MHKQIEQKLKSLPKTPGVYFHKNTKGEIIYVGKAAVLSNRVRQYFQKSRGRDPKTEALVAEIADTDWMEVASELEALFLEAEMVRRYMPRYNILLRDDKSMSYIRIDYDSDFPTVSMTRRPLDDGARYFGPYLSVQSVRQALKLLRRVFPFATRQIPGQKRATLHYHLGLDPGLEEGRTTLEAYRANLRKLIAIIEGKRNSIEKELEKDMKRFAKNAQFEQAAQARNQLFSLRRLNQQVIFSDKEFLDISKDHALNELAELLGLYENEDTHADGVQGADEQRTETYTKYDEGAAQSATKQSAATSDSAAGSAGRQDRRLRILRRIEGYDISHMSGTDVVASMVVFTNGASNKAQYRKFKTKIDHNNDFYNMHETIKRRLKHVPRGAGAEAGHGVSEQASKAYREYYERAAELTTKLSTASSSSVSGSARKQATTTRSSGWELPSLVLIDGGKGQLDAAIRARDEAGQTSIPFIGLAKREEQIVIRKASQVKSQKSKVQSPSSQVELNYEVLRKLGGFATESDDYVLVNLPKNTNLVKLLQRIRDESHRFAVSYHSVLKVKRQTASLLDDIPTIGPATRKKLLNTFGSFSGIMQARQVEIMKTIGEKRGTILLQYLRAFKKQPKL